MEDAGSGWATGQISALVGDGDEELGKCTTLRRKLWIADVKSAMEAKLKQQQQMTEQESDNHRKREEEPENTEEWKRTDRTTEQECKSHKYWRITTGLHTYLCVWHDNQSGLCVFWFESTTLLKGETTKMDNELCTYALLLRLMPLMIHLERKDIFLPNWMFELKIVGHFLDIEIREI